MALRTLAKRGESIPSLFNDLFRPWESFFDVNGGSLVPSFGTINIPAANVIENKDHYEVDLAVPGMKNEDFNIDVEGNLLTISAEKEEKKEEKDERYSRKEFSFVSFSRSFTLPDWVNKDKIDASYENGLLKVHLPKTEDAKKLPSKHITVK
jgi:HSP20 family protein